MSAKQPLIMIAAGGTGGHIFPALATAKALQQRGVAVVWVGTAKRMEADIIPKYNLPLEFIDVEGLRGQGVKRLLQAPWRLLHASWQAYALLGKYQPAMVLAMGGFVCGPVGVAAKMRAVPLVIHEQNSIAGFTNKILSKFCQQVLTAFPDVFPHQPAVMQTGNPVRENLLQLPTIAQRFAARKGRLRVLVLGGSQGAKVFAELLPEAIAQLPAHERPEIRHQTGAQYRQLAEENYRAFAVTAQTEAFIEDMAAAYSWADLVIGRSGALTVAELSTVGVASLLIPFPHAVDDHQTSNARALVNLGAAIVLPQQQLSSAVLADKLRELLRDRTTLLYMATQAQQLSHARATAAVVAVCREYCHHA